MVEQTHPSAKQAPAPHHPTLAGSAAHVAANDIGATTVFGAIGVTIGGTFTALYTKGKDALHALSGAASHLHENHIKPAIAHVQSWPGKIADAFHEHVTVPLGRAVDAVRAIPGRIGSAIHEHAIKPVVDWADRHMHGTMEVVRGAARWGHENIIRPIGRAVDAVRHVPGRIAEAFHENIAKPLGRAVEWVGHLPGRAGELLERGARFMHDLPGKAWTAIAERAGAAGRAVTRGLAFVGERLTIVGDVLATGAKMASRAIGGAVILFDGAEAAYGMSANNSRATGESLARISVGVLGAAALGTFVVLTAPVSGPALLLAAGGAALTGYFVGNAGGQFGHDLIGPMGRFYDDMGGRLNNTGFARDFRNSDGRRFTKQGGDAVVNGYDQITNQITGQSPPNPAQPDVVVPQVPRAPKAPVSMGVPNS